MADARASSTSEFGAFVSPTVDLKKKLSFTGALGTPGRGILEASAQPLRAYCRVRPLRPEERSKGVSVIRVDRPCTVRVMTREEAEAEAAAEAGAEAGALDSAGSSFTFDGVFDASTSQGELYTASFRPVVESAVHRGSHGLLFAYGMTSAGKTYTISGSDNAPGLLPRVLHSVFSEIKAAREREAAKTARRVSGAEGEEDAGNDDDDSGTAAAGEEEEEKTGDAAATADGAAHEAGDASDSLGRRASDSTLARFTITVSYLEVYNEGVYDLLSDMPDEDAEGTATNEGAKAKGSRPPRHKGAATAAAASSKPHRVQLRLKEGRDGRVYVRGLRTVTVPSLGRALEIMQQGAANKRVAETRLNADSSRSHTVFTVSIFRHDPVTGTAEGSSSSSSASSASSSAVTATASCRMSLWSRLSVVDLAGCERASRSGATGVRLKEAGNINRSLSALMNCLDALRHNHKAATAAAAKGTAAQLRMVPYRESKLTRLFSGALSGASRGAVVMVVNAGPAAADREETMRALKYGAVAREVRIVPRVDSSKGGAGAGKDGQPAVEYDMDGRRVRRGAAAAAASTGEHGEGGDENATAENAGDAPKAVEGGGRRRAGIGARAGRVRRGRMGKRGALANATASSAAGDKPASHPAAGEEDTTGAGASKGGSGSSDAAKELADLRARFYREKDAWLEDKAALETEKEELRERWEEAVEALEAAQEEAARVEAEVREEVVSEMETRMVAMQAEWTKRAEANEARADARAQKLLGIAAQRTTAKKARAKASRLQELGAGENGEEGDETDTGSDLGTPFTSAASPIRGMPGFEQAPADAEEESSLAAAIRSAAEHEVARRLSARLSMLPGSASSRSSGGEDADGAREAPEGIQEGEEEDEEDSDEEEEEDDEDDGGLARSRVHRGVRLSSLSDGGAEADGFAMAEALARAEAAEAEAAELREAVAEGEAEASRVRERHVAELSALREDLEEARMDAAEAEAGVERSGGSDAGGAEEETVAELRKRVNVLESKLREAEQRAEAAEKEAGVLRSKASDAESDAAALRVRVQALESHVRRHAAMPLAGLLESMKASSSAQQSMVGLAARAASPRASSQSSQQDIESKAAAAPAEDEEESIAEADAEASATDEHEVDDEATEADSEDDSDAGITAEAAKSVAPQPEPEDDDDGEEDEEEEEEDEDEEDEAEDDDECWGTPPAVRPTRKGRAGGVRVPAASRAKKAAAGSVPPPNARGQRKPVYRSRRRAKLEEDEEEEKDEEGDEEEGGTASTGPRARPKRSSSPPLEEEDDTEEEEDDEDDDEEEDDEEADEDEPSPSPVRARRTRRTRGNPAPAADDDDDDEQDEEEDSAPIGRRLRARRARK